MARFWRNQELWQPPELYPIDVRLIVYYFPFSSQASWSRAAMALYAVVLSISTSWWCSAMLRNCRTNPRKSTSSGFKIPFSFNFSITYGAGLDLDCSSEVEPYRATRAVPSNSTHAAISAALESILRIEKYASLHLCLGHSVNHRTSSLPDQRLLQHVVRTRLRTRHASGE